MASNRPAVASGRDEYGPGFQVLGSIAGSKDLMIVACILYLLCSDGMRIATF